MQDPLLQPLDDLLGSIKNANNDFKKNTDLILAESQKNADELNTLSAQTDLELQEDEKKVIADLDTQVLGLIADSQEPEKYV